MSSDGESSFGSDSDGELAELLASAEIDDETAERFAAAVAGAVAAAVAVSEGDDGGSGSDGSGGGGSSDGGSSDGGSDGDTVSEAAAAELEELLCRLEAEAAMPRLVRIFGTTLTGIECAWVKDNCGEAAAPPPPQLEPSVAAPAWREREHARHVGGPPLGRVGAILTHIEFLCDVPGPVELRGVCQTDQDFLTTLFPEHVFTSAAAALISETGEAPAPSDPAEALYRWRPDEWPAEGELRTVPFGPLDAVETRLRTGAMPVSVPSCSLSEALAAESLRREFASYPRALPAVPGFCCCHDCARAGAICELYARRRGGETRVVAAWLLATVLHHAGRTLDVPPHGERPDEPPQKKRDAALRHVGRARRHSGRRPAGPSRR